MCCCHRIFFILVALPVVTVVPLRGDEPKTDNAKRPPNIVFILADDLGWTDLGCYGSKYYETPNLDRLAKQGMRFTAYYACPNCAPTRAALMSGQYAPRTGIYTVGTLARGEDAFRKMVPPENVTKLPLDKVTIAAALKKAGYATAIYGKWHLGDNGDYHPGKRGFDDALVTMGRHFDFITNPPTRYEPGTYLADFLTDRAVAFIEKNKDRPFFLYLPHFGVHVPLQAKKELIAKYEKKKPVGGHGNPTYAAMIESVDQSVGRVMAALDRWHLADNTVLIFSSDNGGVGGYEAAGVVGAKDNTSNAPLRGGKGMLYEGGIRDPLIVRWPATVKAGTTCDEPVVNVDLYPTLLDVAAAKADSKYTLDGVSFLPLLRSDGSARLKRDAIYWHFPGYLEANVKRGTWRTTPAAAIRAGDYKLIEFFEDGRLELYNLKDDIGEKTDFSKKLPDQVKELHRKLVDWRQKTKAAMPKAKGDAKKSDAE
jgi:arylsulfatase A-like enzyme